MSLALLASIVVGKAPDNTMSALLVLGSVSAIGLLARFVKNQKK
jgi:hypothetical protein